MRKPHSTLVLLGPRGHGKTSLAAALRRASGSAAPQAEPPREQVAPLPRAARVSFALVAAELESTRRRYTLLDPGDRHAVRKRLIAGPLAGLPAVDGAVLVVEAGQRCGPACRDDLRLLRRLGAPGLVVLLNRAADDDPEFVDLAEQELRVELCEAGFAGDAVPIVRASLASLRDGDPAGAEAALSLVEALDLHVVDRADAPPRYVVTRVLASDRREQTVDCRPLQGALQPDERVELLGLTATRTAQLVATEPTPPGPDPADDRVRCTLRGVTADDLRVGQVLAPPGTRAPHDRLEADVWFLVPFARQTEEWQLACFDAVTVSGLARPVEGSAHAYDVELTSALALAPGDGFGVLEAGELIAVGVVVAARGATRKRRRDPLSPTGLALAFVDSLHRGDRPDITASLLCPPEDVLQATAPGLVEDVWSEFRSGRILLRLVGDGRRSNSPFARFDYPGVLTPPAGVEYIAPHGADPAPTRHLGRGSSQHVWGMRGSNEYRLKRGLTQSSVRFQIAVTRGQVREDMIVALSIAAFDVRPDVWYLFDFVYPYSWQNL